MPEKVRILFDDDGKPRAKPEPGLPTNFNNDTSLASIETEKNSSRSGGKRKRDEFGQGSRRTGLDGVYDRSPDDKSDPSRQKHKHSKQYLNKRENLEAKLGNDLKADGNATASSGDVLKFQKATNKLSLRGNRHNGQASSANGGNGSDISRSNSANVQLYDKLASNTQSHRKDDRFSLFKNANRNQNRPFTARQPNSAATSIPNGKIKAPGDSLGEKARKLQPFRQALPIWSYQTEIHECLSGSSDIMLLVGETGSGKSTQVPQFLLTEPWCKGRIAVTQPRRVAAFSLAKRVAEEMGSHLGTASPSSRVGYSVRFDNCVSPNTRIKYLTEGMLLQEMLKDPGLKEYSAIVVDEVHERSLNVDLILGFVRNLVTGANTARNGKPLKVVVMSATINVEKLAHYFDEGFEEQKRTRIDHVDNKKIEEESADGESSEESWAGLSSDVESEASPGKGTLSEESSKSSLGEHKSDVVVNGIKIDEKDKNGLAERELSEHGRMTKTSSSTNTNTPNTNSRPRKEKSQLNNEDRISLLLVEGRNFPVEIKYLSNPTNDLSEDALSLIFKIHTREPLPGDILVFLTGQDTVESLENQVNEVAKELGPQVPKLLAFPLFAALPRPSQAAVFEKPPPKTRRVILSTNIAETSVTIPNIRHVIDSGLFKLKEFRPSLGLDSLLTKEISMSSAIQRKGRAGREAAGHCYRLYTEDAYLAMERESKPEILRCNLASAVLNMFARGVDNPKSFPFVDAPDSHALDVALLELFQHRAINVDHASGTSKTSITSRGRVMARLPLSIQLADTLLVAAEPRFNVAAEVVDIISALTVENIFLQFSDEVQREEVLEARRNVTNRRGDHLTLLTTVRAYAAENADRKEWCKRRGISHRAMQSVMDVRKQLLTQAANEGLLSKPPTKPGGTVITERDGKDDSDDDAETLTTEKGDAILKSFLRGFISNTAIRGADKAYRTFYGRQKVAVHPSSVIAGKAVECFLYQELVFTNRCWARGVSAVEFGWLMDAVKEGEEVVQRDDSQ